MKRVGPRRVARTTSTALPSRREILATLAATGGALAFPSLLAAQPASPAPSASASASAAPESDHVLVVSPDMGRVVLVFDASPPEFRVMVDGKELPKIAIVAEPPNVADAGTNEGASLGDAGPMRSDPADASATPTSDAGPANIGPTRFGIYAPAGARQITVMVPPFAPVTVGANVALGQSVEVHIVPRDSLQVAGGIGGSDYVMPAGCCGGSHDTSADASTRAPALAGSAIALVALLLRKRIDPRR